MTSWKKQTTQCSGMSIRSTRRCGSSAASFAGSNSRMGMSWYVILRYGAARVGAGIPRPIALITNAGGEYPPLRARYCSLQLSRQPRHFINQLRVAQIVLDLKDQARADHRAVGVTPHVAHMLRFRYAEAYRDRQA